MHVIEHVYDDVLFLRSMLRILRPGGRIVSLVPARPSGDTDLTEWRDNAHYRLWNYARVQNIAEILKHEAVLVETIQTQVVYMWLCPFIRFIEKGICFPIFLLTGKRENELTAIQWINSNLVKLLDKWDSLYYRSSQARRSNIVFTFIKREIGESPEMTLENYFK